MYTVGLRNGYQKLELGQRLMRTSADAFSIANIVQVKQQAQNKMYCLSCSV
jgi:hypothetical protein